MDELSQQINSYTSIKRHGETKLQKIEETITKLNVRHLILTIHC